MSVLPGTGVPPEVETGTDTAARARFRFPRRQRIVDSDGYDRTFSSGKRRVGRLVVVWVRPNGGTEWRLGVIASKRSFRRAADRNRAKRLIREAFRLGCQELPGACDLVVVARGFILRAGESDVRKELLQLAKEASRKGGVR